MSDTATDPDKLPVILCHGLGLNATFWTITDHHLPVQLTARGYEVYVFDIRGSGENARPGRHDRINRLLNAVVIICTAIWLATPRLRPRPPTRQRLSPSSVARRGT